MLLSWPVITSEVRLERLLLEYSNEAHIRVGSKGLLLPDVDMAEHAPELFHMLFPDRDAGRVVQVGKQLLAARSNLFSGSDSDSDSDSGADEEGEQEDKRTAENVDAV